MLKMLKAIIATTVAFTSPVSVAMAQTTDTSCSLNCNDIHYNDIQGCMEVWFLDNRDLCFYAADRDYEACLDTCVVETSSIQSDRPQSVRYHRVDLEVG